MSFGNKSAALLWAFGSEGRYYNVSANLERRGKLAYIGRSLFSLDKEVEDRAVMPYIVSARKKRNLCHIAYQPIHSLRFRSQTVLGFFDRPFGNVQNGEGTILPDKQIVDKRGFAASHVNDRSGSVGAGI